MEDLKTIAMDHVNGLRRCNVPHEITSRNLSVLLDFINTKADAITAWNTRYTPSVKELEDVFRNHRIDCSMAFKGVESDKELAEKIHALMDGKLDERD